MDVDLQINMYTHEARVPVTVFELAGELDASNYDQFLHKTLGALDAGAQYVVLDLSRLRYISSAGLRAVYTLERALSDKEEVPAGGSDANPGSFKSPYLKLFNPLPNVRHALDLMGLTTSLEIYSDLSEALGSF